MLPRRFPTLTLLALVAGLLLCGPAPAAPQQDEKKEPAAQDKDKQPAEPGDLKTRLKKYDEELWKIRQAMLQECDAEARRIDEAIKKVKEGLEQAYKAKNQTAASILSQKLGKLQSEKGKVAGLRADVERRVQIVKEVPRPVTEQQLGLFLSPVSGALRQQLNLGKDEGLVVDTVIAESVAFRAGLRQYDILVQLNGQPVKGGTTALRKELAALAAEATVDVVVLRHGKQETIKGLKLPPPKVR
jgi:C-terminal processing protease CtpA/Prc